MFTHTMKIVTHVEGNLIEAGGGERIESLVRTRELLVLKRVITGEQEYESELQGPLTRSQSGISPQLFR